MFISKWWSNIWVGQFWCYVSVSSKYIFVKYRNIKSWSGAQIFLLQWVILYHHFVSEGISFYIHHRKYKFSWTIVTARKRSCGKVMFSQVSVLSTGGGLGTSHASWDKSHTLPSGYLPPNTIPPLPRTSDLGTCSNLFTWALPLATDILWLLLDLSPSSLDI